jgi:signal peptidase
MRARKKIFSWLLLAVALGAWAVFLRPTSLGGSASYVMVSGKSMEPKMHTGDLVITTRAATYEPGDVVAFRIPEGEPAAGATVIHRVTGGNGTDGYTTQGDNRELADQWHPTEADVQGRMALRIPKAGSLVAFLRAPLGIALVAALFVFLVVVFDRSPQRESGEAPRGSALQKLGRRYRGEDQTGDPVRDFYPADPRAASELRHKL